MAFECGKFASDPPLLVTSTLCLTDGLWFQAPQKRPTVRCTSPELPVPIALILTKRWLRSTKRLVALGHFRCLSTPNRRSMACFLCACLSIRASSKS